MGHLGRAPASGVTRDPAVEPSFAMLVSRLHRAGCVAAEDEAVELWRAATPSDGPRPDPDRLLAMTDRRCQGEPLAWIVGSAPFGGTRVVVHHGVYVPRPQTEALAERAAGYLPERGTAIDLCTGCGAVAVVLRLRRPDATVLGTEADPVAAACAEANGVTVHRGDLDQHLPPWCPGRVDVVTAVVPYVPTPALHLLPRDVVAYEPLSALDGGADGTDVLRRAVHAGARLLRPGGWLLLELGGDQADLLRPDLAAAGFGGPDQLVDAEGDVRGIAARRCGQRP